MRCPSPSAAAGWEHPPRSHVLSPARPWFSGPGREDDPAGSPRRSGSGANRAALRGSARQRPECRRTRSAADRSSPLAGARELADPPDNHVAFETAEVIDEELSVEMVHFVLKRTRQQVRAFALVVLPGATEAFDDGAYRPHDRRVEPREAEAALLFELPAVAQDKLRIDHD